MKKEESPFLEIVIRAKNEKELLAQLERQVKFLKEKIAEQEKIKLKTSNSQTLRLSYDQKNQIFYLDGKLLKMEASSLKMLRYFYTHRGQKVLYRQLFKHFQLDKFPLPQVKDLIKKLQIDLEMMGVEDFASMIKEINGGYIFKTTK